MSLPRGATGSYTDADGNAHACLVIGQAYEVKSPGRNPDGSELPKTRVYKSGVVIAQLYDEHGASYQDEIAESAITVASSPPDASVAARVSSLETQIQSLQAAVAAKAGG